MVKPKVNKIFSKVFEFIFKIYKYFLSPFLYTISLSTVGGGCRFYPTCSEYANQAVQLYGLNYKSIKLILSRLLRCRSFFLFKNKNKCKYSGLDPVA